MIYGNEKKREALICAAQLCNQKNITDASEILMQIHDELDRPAAVMAIVDEMVDRIESKEYQLPQFGWSGIIEELIAARKEMQ